MSVTRSVIPGDDSTLTREPYTGKHLAAIAAAGITHTEVGIADDPAQPYAMLHVVIGSRYYVAPLQRGMLADAPAMAAMTDDLAYRAWQGDTP